MGSKSEGIEIAAGGRPVRITSPDKMWFPAIGAAKLEVAEYFVAVADGALRALRDRPTVMHRFPDGVEGEGFFQKRVGRAASWVETVSVGFPAGGHADELCPTEPAHVLWAVNLGCLEFHPWQVRREDLLRPDELRLDLDPQPGVTWETVREAARVTRQVLADADMQGFPKTSGGRGLHVYVRIRPQWGYLPVRRAVLALAREIERRAPKIATAEWWKQDRGERVFIDFNQNLPDKTVTSAYSVRPGPEARVSCPITWSELDEIEPADFTIRTVPARYAERGDVMAALDEQAYSLDPILEWVERDERAGLGEAPFPPHFPKMPGEPPRVHPSRARKPAEPP